MNDDIVAQLRQMVSRCWCAEKSQNEPVGKPFFRCESCDNQLRAADQIERLQAQNEDCNNDFHALKEMFDKVRADRDRWHDIANGLATHIEQASSNNARALQDYDNMVYKEMYGD